ncbi:uncharacterized protein PHALS_08316 [Plasmopara halstedii]|uniref:Uncharacterized protein n=1 Tax=Plasmopara halstedii TaxID=4781 RepID=A0A0P1ABJ9_PLAHL|nr:uncharacterized protein PHALS_08316 [Plasmopara halstedii]CEG38229.1 hypothetical protein PHALS_08316 [Plasmopara halstedii]|eukprot:XP_024574598.1 hypothetical protein PHALS_08316 [Plasmopara halstedii]
MSLSSSTLQAFAVEGITYSILCFLHVSDVDAIVSLFHETTELQGHLQDKLLWTQLLKQHFKGSRNIELRFSQHPMQDRGWNYTNRELTCVELQEFLHSMDECLNFDKTIQIVKGDIGDIQDIDGQTLDGIAFPTNSHLTNHYIGMTCVAMVSISTGNMGVPGDEGAQVALRTIQKFLRLNDWKGKLAILGLNVYSISRPSMIFFDTYITKIYILVDTHIQPNPISISRFLPRVIVQH